MRLITKIGIGIFLCLSFFMIACSIIRAAGTYYRSALDYPWQVFWLHAEACIGLIMGSITVYRSTLVGSSEVSEKIHTYLRRLRGKRSTSGPTGTPESDSMADSKPHKLSLKVPRATLTGLRTMFGARTQTNTLPTTATVSTINSEYALMEMDYHAHIRAQAATHSRKTSGDDDKSAY
jgi:hypothetical protein